jgi:hypothetical protein
VFSSRYVRWSTHFLRCDFDENGLRKSGGKCEKFQGIQTGRPATLRRETVAYCSYLRVTAWIVMIAQKLFDKTSISFKHWIYEYGWSYVYTAMC